MKDYSNLSRLNPHLAILLEIRDALRANRHTPCPMRLQYLATKLRRNHELS